MSTRSQRHSIRHLSAFATAICLMAPLYPKSALAQQSGSANLMDDILVTAQRREEVAQDIPLAVTSYNADQLERLQVTEVLDIGRLVPNLIAHNNTGLGTANNYALRGLNNTESVATFDAPVGAYVDDIYVARQNANNFTLFDVDRIEVLRGPQGTLFGRNTTGGAVRVILKKPAEELGGYGEIGAGSFDRYSIRGSIDVPITDRVLTKLSAYWVDDDGFVDNLTTGEDDINKEENFGIRGHVLFELTDALSWDLALDYIEDEHANLLNTKDGGSRITTTGLTEGGGGLVGTMTGEKQSFGLGNETETLSLSSVFEWEIDNLGQLRFITGWRDLDHDFALDFFSGAAAYGGFTIANAGEHEQFTQEITLSGTWRDSVDWVAGVFYLDEDNSTNFGDIFDVGIPLLLADRVLDNTTEAWAIFAQGDYQLSDRWTLTAGVRYTDEEKKIGVSDNNPCRADSTAAFPGGCNFDDDGDSGTPAVFLDTNGDGIDDFDLATVNLGLMPTMVNGQMLFANQPLPTSQTTQLWTPRVALQFAWTDDLQVYASATRGFKSGGWNARGTDPSQLLNFSPEVVWSYELGMKSDWLDNTLRVNLTAFYSDISDFQLPSAFTTATGGIVFITRNFADLEITGFEGEIIWLPLDNLTVFSNFGIQDAEYQNLDPSITAQQQDCINNGMRCGQGIVDLNGQIAEPTRAPDYTVNVGFNYVWPIAGNMELVPGANFYAVGDHNVGTSGLPAGLVDGYATYSASVALNHLDQDWSLALGCRNCGDRAQVVSLLAGLSYLQDPRTWALTFKKRFGQR